VVIAPQKRRISAESVAYVTAAVIVGIARGSEEFFLADLADVSGFENLSSSKRRNGSIGSHLSSTAEVRYPCDMLVGFESPRLHS
jgi:hypothetical protein